MDTGKIVEEILNEFDSRVRDISLEDYIEVLNSLLSDLESRLGAAEVQREQEEEEE